MVEGILHQLSVVRSPACFDQDIHPAAAGGTGLGPPKGGQVLIQPWGQIVGFTRDMLHVVIGPACHAGGSRADVHQLPHDRASVDSAFAAEDGGVIVPMGDRQGVMVDGGIKHNPDLSVESSMGVIASSGCYTLLPGFSPLRARPSPSPS